MYIANLNNTYVMLLHRKEVTKLKYHVCAKKLSQSKFKYVNLLIRNKQYMDLPVFSLGYLIIPVFSIENMC